MVENAYKRAELFIYRKTPYLVPGSTLVFKKKISIEGSARFQMQHQNFSKIF
jgi:hypothetical protein